MIADYMFDIFQTAKTRGVDTVVALDILRGNQPIPAGMNRQEINEFVGLHFDQLRRAYQTGSRKLFADIVAICQTGKQEEADMCFRAHETGSEKLISEMEARYGGDCHG